MTEVGESEAEALVVYPGGPWLDDQYVQVVWSCMRCGVMVPHLKKFAMRCCSSRMH